MSLTDPLGGSPRKLTPALGFPPRIGVVEPYTFPAAATAYSFVVPYTGKWKFVGWGPGGESGLTESGGSGGYFEITRPLRRGSVVTITAGYKEGATRTNTIVVLPSGETATATRATNTTAGTATGGDVNLAGSAGLSSSGANGNAGLGTGGGPGGTGSGGTEPGGAGAPANLPYRGGQGGGFGATPRSAGIGAGAGVSGADAQSGGMGLVLAVLMSA